MRKIHPNFSNRFTPHWQALTIVTQRAFSGAFFIFTLYFCLMIPLFGDVTPLHAAQAPLRLVIIGDSTVCEYPPKRDCRGWGQYIQGYFKDTVKVINLARSGRSTKTFINEGLWAKTLEAKPDILLIEHLLHSSCKVLFNFCSLYGILSAIGSLVPAVFSLQDSKKAPCQSKH